MAFTSVTARRTWATLAMRRACLVQAAKVSQPQHRILSQQARTLKTCPQLSSPCLLSSKSNPFLHQNRSFSISQVLWSKKKAASPGHGDSKEVNLFGADGLFIGKMTAFAAERRAAQSGATLTDMGVNAEGVQGWQLSGSGAPAPAASSKKSKADKPKGEKEFRINAQITEHDLAIKLKNIKDILSKGKMVKITIALRGHQHMKQGDKNIKGTFQKICQETEELALVKVASKLPTSMAFVLQPKAAPTDKQQEREAA